MPEMLPPPSRVSDPDMHHGTCVSNQCHLAAMDLMGRGPPTWILGSSAVNFWVIYFLTVLNMKLAHGTSFYASDQFMPNWRRHGRRLFAILSSCLSQYISDFECCIHCLNEIFPKLLWYLNSVDISIFLYTQKHTCLQNEEWLPLLTVPSRCWHN